MRRRYLLVAFLITLAVAGSFSRQPPAGSTFVSSNLGSQALFALLEKIEAKPIRHLQPFDRLPADFNDYTLFIIAPPELAGETYLSDWVAAGNRLVFFDSPAGKNGKVLEKFGINKPSMLSREFELPKPTDASSFLEMPAEADPRAADPAAGIDQISTPQGIPIITATNQIALISSDKLASALWQPFDKGDLWYFIGAEPALNRRIDLNDNLKLLLQLIKNPDHLLFDEFHHGFREPVAEEMQQRWDLMIFLLCGIGAVILLSFVSRAVRFGPPLRTLTSSVAQTTEFITALGLLYANYRAVSALKGYASAWKKRICRRFSIKPDRSNEMVAEELLQAGVLSLPERSRLITILNQLGSDEQNSPPPAKRLESDILFIESIEKRAAAGGPR